MCAFVFIGREVIAFIRITGEFKTQKRSRATILEHINRKAETEKPSSPSIRLKIKPAQPVLELSQCVPLSPKASNSISARCRHLERIIFLELRATLRLNPVPTTLTTWHLQG